MLYSLFSKIWEKKEVPAQWKEGIIIKLSKKEDLGGCSNYRGIMLLSTPGKILRRVLLEKMKEVVDPKLLDQQQASCRTDLVPTRSPECASSWNSNWSGTPPLHKIHRLSEGLRQCRQRDNVEATETLWSSREDNLPHPVHLSEHELQNCPRRPAV